MPYIKKLVMHGFKSFPKKTELPFTSDINVILGPNGSGKSNISDALCFVLGRLSVKSMRAAKARNLIFQGTKSAAPSKEAMVEMVIDNSDKVFSIAKNEISIKRVVRKNGLSVYKINDETKTRQDVLSLLAQAGIDSNGFNIILQGEIQNFTRMHPEERRKIIEEVAGISIYESRKQKSLKELEKTEERLKEISAILRERTAYLNNLEKERQQALRFKKLESDVRKFKASIIHSDLTKKGKELEGINREIEEKTKKTGKLKKTIIEIKAEVEILESKIENIDSDIKKSTGLEQEKLNQEINNIRAELAGLNVKVENYESKISEISNQKMDIEQQIEGSQESIGDLKKEPVTVLRKQKEIESKKKEMDRVEEERKRFYTVKSDLKSMRQRFDDKNGLLKNYENESELVLRQISQISEELFDSKTSNEKLSSLKSSLREKEEKVLEITKKESEISRVFYTHQYEIEKQEKLKEKISKLDICPVCKSKMTKEHVEVISKESNDEIKKLKDEIEKTKSEFSKLKKEKEELEKEIKEIKKEMTKRESDLIKISSINEKKGQIKSLQERIDSLKKEIHEIDKTRKNLEKNFNENSNIEQKYETLRIEIQEISLRSKENVDSEISFKQKELERAKISLKQLIREEEDLRENLDETQKTIEEKEEELESKRNQEEELSKKFQKMISEKESLQRKVRENENSISEKQNLIHDEEQEINRVSIEKAKTKAEIENLETDMLEFPDTEIIKANKESLIQRLEKARETLSRLGTVNLLSLEVYDSVKKEYDSVKEKADIIVKEKDDIMKVIAEIDTKKKKTFMRTLEELNGIFSRNFSSLSSKGVVSLDLEDKKTPFEGGVNILVKTGHGKYFDAHSLSGGEQTLVALSLIFGIQELKPYCFYILDEIDAALDKRNSEKLAELLKKYMKKGQYIVISHNDEIITNASNLYGVSMHEGVSKIVSLKI